MDENEDDRLQDICCKFPHRGRIGIPTCIRRMYVSGVCFAMLARLGRSGPNWARGQRCVLEAYRDSTGYWV